jgi:hypothetical protein
MLKKKTYDIVFEFLALLRGHGLNRHGPCREVACLDTIPAVGEVKNRLSEENMACLRSWVL